MHVPSDKTKASNNDKQIIPSTNYIHGSVETNSRSHKDSLEALQIRIQPLTAQKVELNKRIKSGHSIRSEVDSIHASIYPLDTKPSSPVFMTNSVNLTTKSSNLPQMNTENVHVVMHGNSVKQKNVSSSKECVSKESSLAAIYGPQNNIPQRAYSNADDFRKVKKIFLSEKQSGTLKENGMEFPCAPPATPVPGNVNRDYDKCPKILNTFNIPYFFFLNFAFYAVFFLRKILSEMANSVDPELWSSLIWVCTVCIYHFDRNFGVQNFKTFTI